MKIRTDNEKKSLAFENIYLAYFSKMKYFAKVYILSEEDAANIVQDIFTELWEKRELLEMQIDLVAYLFAATKNRCLNYLRHQTIVQEGMNVIKESHKLALDMSLNSLEAFEMNDFSQKEIADLIDRALNSLPKKCREIFVLNKLEGRKQREIASMMNLSVHTIENQIAIAFQKLRVEMKDYYPLLLFLFFS